MQRHITYARNEPYPQSGDEPPGDSVGLFLEGIPTFKIWFAPPVDLERDLLDSTCTHIGLVPPIIIPGGGTLRSFKSGHRPDHRLWGRGFKSDHRGDHRPFGQQTGLWTVEPLRTLP
jgi:hypothetical protein